MTATKRLGLLLLPLAFVVSGDALAWWNPGHQIVCEIAGQRLTPAGRELVKTVRQDGQDSFGTFHASCGWPGKAHGASHKATRQYHFVNVPVDAGTLEMARDCAPLDCAPVGIEHFALYLAQEPSGSTAKTQRLHALRFMSHFVGDVHQPLHVRHGIDRQCEDIHGAGQPLSPRHATRGALFQNRAEEAWDKDHRFAFGLQALLGIDTDQHLLGDARGGRGASRYE